MIDKTRLLQYTYIESAIGKEICQWPRIDLLEMLHVVLGPMNLKLGHIRNMSSILTAKLSTTTVGYVHHTPYLADNGSDSRKVSKFIRVVSKMQSTIL